jgi:outer membrane protein
MRPIQKVVLLALAAGLSSGHLAAQENPANPSGAPQSGSGTNPHMLTIQEAEAIGIRNNPQISVGRLRALQAREFVREARSALMPTATLSVTGVESRAGSRIAAGYLNNPVIYPRAAAGASVTQLITDFGRTTNLLSSSEFQQKAEDENAVATQQQVVLAVDEAFYNTLETKALLQVAQETVDARQLLVDQVSALTNAKLRSDLDLSFSQVDLSRAKLLQLQAQSNYAASLATLSAVLGYQEKQEFEPVEPATQMANPVADAAPLIQQALQQRPEVLSLRQEVTAAEKFAHAEHDLWKPSINAAGAVGLAPVRDDHIDNWYGAAGVNINIPVFNGFLFNARSKSADLQTELQQKKLQDLQNNVARDVRNGWLDTQTAFARLSLTEELRQQANLALDLAQARYKLGLSSIVEFSQAELQKTDADLQNTDAKYQYRLSQILLAYQMGEKR